MAISDSQYTEWLSAPSAIRCVLVEATCNSGGSEVVRYMSNRGYVTSSSATPANTVYRAIISGGVRLTENLSLDSNPTLSYGDIEIENDNGDLDSWLLDVWDNRAISVFYGDMRWERSDFRNVFKGTLEGIKSSARGKINLTLRDSLQRLNTPITDVKLGGTTVNKDKLIPLTFGEVHNVSPLLVDPVAHTYRVHNGAIEDIIEVRDNGAPITVTKDLATGSFTLANSAVGTVTCSVQGSKPVTYSNQIAENVKHIVKTYGNADNRLSDTIILGSELIANGTFDTDTSGWSAILGSTLTWIVGGKMQMLSSGYSNMMATVVVSTVASKSYTITYTPDLSNSIGIYAGTALGGTDVLFQTPTVGTAGVQRSVVFTAISSTTYISLVGGGANSTNTIDNFSCKLIVKDSDIDLTNFNNFAAANTAPVGVYFSEKTNLLEACQLLAGSVGAQVTMSRKGLLQLLRIDFPAVGTPTAINKKHIKDREFAIDSIVDVMPAVQIGYCKNYTVQNNLQTVVPEDHKSLYSQEWLTKTLDDSAVATKYKMLTEPNQKDTQLLTEADATAESTRRLNIIKTQRTVYKMTCFSSMLQLTLGQAVTVTYDRFGFDAGLTGVVVGLEPDWYNGKINVKVMV